jgi:25S rRNA (uracil2634-N3)-methyltransferase
MLRHALLRKLSALRREHEQQPKKRKKARAAPSVPAPSAHAAEEPTQPWPLEPRPAELYTGDQKILLLGEGDFSFALSLARRFGSGRNILATSLDSEAFLHAQYAETKGNIAELRRLGALVVHDFDATKLHLHVTTSRSENKLCFVDVIVWNFPHPGWPPNVLSMLNKNKRGQPQTAVQEDDPTMINSHRKLLKSFFTSALSLAQSTDCAIHLTTVVSKQGFDKWNVYEVGASCGYAMRSAYIFAAGDYPVYRCKVGLPNNPRGKLVDDGFNTSKKGGDLCAVTRVFTLGDVYLERYKLC